MKEHMQAFFNFFQSFYMAFFFFCLYLVWEFIICKMVDIFKPHPLPLPPIFIYQCNLNNKDKFLIILNVLDLKANERVSGLVYILISLNHYVYFIVTGPLLLHKSKLLSQFYLNIVLIICLEIFIKNLVRQKQLC